MVGRTCWSKVSAAPQGVEALRFDGCVSHTSSEWQDVGVGSGVGQSVRVSPCYMIDHRLCGHCEDFMTLTLIQPPSPLWRVRRLMPPALIAVCANTLNLVQSPHTSVQRVCYVRSHMPSRQDKTRQDKTKTSDEPAGKSRAPDMTQVNNDVVGATLLHTIRSTHTMGAALIVSLALTLPLPPSSWPELLHFDLLQPAAGP